MKILKIWENETKIEFEFFQSLASLEEKINPGQLESDKDRLLLIQEKEQLLRELRSISPRNRPLQEMERIQRYWSSWN